ncbi:MAG: exo-beta-N-acetylmuramidase NamZ domain-containing protein, partial [candidate division WOR-3 bacterium]
MIYLGIDLINERWPKKFEKARVGILVHSASVNRDLRYSWEVFWDFKRAKLCSIFGPQHGLFGETQANMVEWEGYKDPFTGLTVYSLYGKVRKPTPEMLRDIDGVVVDLQDVGSRYYTYIWTLYLVMEACLENNKFVVVLDRPNPISGDFIEGFVLKER